MIKSKKVLAVILSAGLLCSICLFLVGCEKKYDVSFKLYYTEIQDGKRVLPLLGELIFDKNTDDLNIELDYDGKEYEFFLAEYEDPTYSSKSSSNKTHWENIVGGVHFSLFKEGEENELRETVCERGNYCYIFYVDVHSTLPKSYRIFNPRILRIHISII